VHRRRDFMGVSTIKSMGTGRKDRFAGGMNIIKYSTFPVEEVAYFHLSCGREFPISIFPVGGNFFPTEGFAYFHLSWFRHQYILIQASHCP